MIFRKFILFKVVPDLVDGNCYWKCAVQCNGGCCYYEQICIARKGLTVKKSEIR